MNIEGAIGLQFHELTEHEEEGSHQKTTAQQGNCCQEKTVGDNIPETDTAPADAQKEVDHVADGEELDGTAGIHRIAAAVSEVGIAGTVKTNITIRVAYAHKRKHHLDKENEGSKQGYNPIGAERGLHTFEPGKKCVHANRF